MAAFFALTALWCVTIYLAEDWVEVKKNVLGLIIFAVSEFIVWLINLGQFDPARENILTYGLGLGFFAVLLIYYYWKQERASIKA
jgi:thiol:disulfide interchange protein